jgi:hypothetical protein
VELKSLTLNLKSWNWDDERLLAGRCDATSEVVVFLGKKAGPLTVPLLIRFSRAAIGEPFTKVEDRQTGGRGSSKRQAKRSGIEGTLEGLVRIKDRNPTPAVVPTSPLR